jgi:WD40 repeat protein
MSFSSQDSGIQRIVYCCRFRVRNLNIQHVSMEMVLEILSQHCSRRSQIVCYNVATESPILSRDLAKMMITISTFVLLLHDLPFFRDGNIRIVYTTDTTQSNRLHGHEGAVRYVTYDPQGKYLVSSGCDGTVRIWNTQTNTEEQSFSNFIEPTTVT